MNRVYPHLPMKVLMVTDNLFSGGKERRFVELIKGLAGYPEVECEVMILEKERNTHYREIFDLPFKLHFTPRRSRYDIRIFSGIKKIVIDFNPQIIHCWGSMSAVYSLPVTRLLKRQFVYTVSDAPFSVKRFSRIWWRTKLVFPFSTIITANSQAGLYAYHVHSKKGVVIHNGFNFSRLKKLIHPDEVKHKFNISTKQVVGMVARFRDHKDYATYFSVACDILDQRDDVTFLAIGEGETIENYTNSIEEKYRDRIIFTRGQQSVESLVNIFNIGIL
ncbi:MAG: glycosyltransferase, partial [Bacteroidia bacterium]|nr:glycosyltransferase [Bacteroidia bacterium]